jgi:vacuolar protein sorting-associated protein 29
MNPELVLVVGDMFVPQRSPDISEKFKSILIPNKIQHVLSLGNIGSRESYDWLKSLSNDFHAVKGDYDDGELPEKKVVQIGEFKIGMIHGHQVLPWGDIDALTNVQRELGCDILLSGHTHQISIQAKDKKFYINPGSISGAFSHLIADPSPSFVLMVLQGEEARVFLYILNDKSENFELTTLEFIKGGDNYKEVKEEENDEEEEEVEDEKKEKKVENKEEAKDEENKEEEIKEESDKNEIKDE